MESVGHCKVLSLSTIAIHFWNSAGEFVNPVGSEVIWSSPRGVINAVRSLLLL